MDVIKSLSRRIFLWTFFVMTILCALMCSTFYFGKGFALNVLPLQTLKNAAAHSEALDAGLAKILPLYEIVNAFFIPGLCAVFFLFMVLLWLILRSSMKRLWKKIPPVEHVAPSPVKKKRNGNRWMMFWPSP